MTLLVGCSSPAPFEIDLMPAPDVYDAEGFNPVSDSSPIDDLPYGGILYATDRMPVEKGDKERFYVIQDNSAISSFTSLYDDSICGQTFVGFISTDHIEHIGYRDPSSSGTHMLSVFAVATTVPVLAAAWLFGSALGLLGWMRRKAS